MPDVAGFPYAEVEFRKDGQLHDAAQADAVVAMARDQRLTDLVVLSHGWNNDMEEARRLYACLLGALGPALSAQGALAPRRFGALAVLWPSKKFADKALIPSGAASATSPITDAEILAQLAALDALIDDPAAHDRLAAAAALVPQLEERKSARVEFSRLLLDLLPSAAAGEEHDPLPRADGSDVVTALGTPTPAAAAPPKPGGGGAARIDPDAIQPIAGGGAAGLGNLWGGIKAGAQHLANMVTYYQMKDRAGTVGRTGVVPLLARVAAAQPDLRLHLIGHSFGGRLVTAVASGADGQPAPRVATLTLLQAAFSHYGLANDFGGGKAGAFRRIVDERRVAGPILVTCTHNDRAVGLAYALASRVARQVASGIGDAGDPYGGIGANGAQRTPEAVSGVLGPVGTAYAFQGGRVYNLRADAVIANHSDVCQPAVAHAIAQAVASS